VSTSTPDLPLAGIIPFSATDWPGRLVATAFTQGCPLACRYCHNPTLRPVGPGQVPFSAALQLLDARRGLLDALVISGGEPTMHPGLGAAITAAHALGFPVGLHTSGYSPTRLAALLDTPTTRPDWIGLDIKGLPAAAADVTGCTPAVAARMWETLTLVRDSGLDVQVRTTVWPGSRLENELPLLRARVPGLVVQYARGVDSSGRYHAA